VETPEASSWREVVKAPGLLMGMLGIFMYVGAEVTLGSFLVNYVIERSPMQETQAASLLAIYWGGSMAGRFLGIFTLKEFRPGKVLSFHALLALALILISINSYGLRAIYSMVLVGICNSIMFPTIFTLAIHKIEDRLVHKASGLLGTAILGGAIFPLLTGNIADHLGLRMAYLIPIMCYGYIAYFGEKNKSF
jgi:MFS transporter, FHS family, L-fucose permease